MRTVAVSPLADQTFINRERTDRRAHVAAIALVVDRLIANLNLREGVVDIGIVPH
jgi:hypothetical protein